MTQYLGILANQRPFPIGRDEQDREMFSCNYTARAIANVADWEKEVGKVISTASLGTLGTDMWIGPSVNIPAGDGPYIQIIDTGGIAPDEPHSGEIQERMSVQIVVRATSFATGRSRALAIWRELHGQRNVTVAA